MHQLTSNDLDRLRRSNRRLLSGVLIIIGLVVLWLVLVFAGMIPPIVIGGPLLGVGIGLLLGIPQRRLLRELGVTAAEARRILASDKEDRTENRLSPDQRARGARLRFWIWLASGLLMLVILCVAAAYFLAKAGQTHPQGTPLDPLFVASFLVGFTALIVTPAAFMQANTEWHRAKEWQHLADGASAET